MIRWFLFCVVSAGVGLWAYTRQIPRPPAGDMLSTDDLAATDAATSSPRPHIFAGGIVEGKHREIPLKFEVSGRIRAVHVAEGDVVHAGDMLAELESTQFELQVAEARARLKIARAERDHLVAESQRLTRAAAADLLPATEERANEAEAEFDRSQKLFVQNAISRKAFDQVRQQRTELASQVQDLRQQVDHPQPQLTAAEETLAEGKIALADAALRREQLLLAKSTLRTPADGQVLQALPQIGELAGPSTEVLFLLAARGPTYVRAFVEELDALHVAPGQSAVITVSGQPGVEHTGTIRTCAPHVRPKHHRHLKPGEHLDVRVREVLIELDDGSSLLIGLPVEVLIRQH